MSVPTTLLLLRHGDIAGIAPPRFRGRADPPLSAKGERQAGKLAAYLASNWSINALRVSPRARCAATAAPLAATTGLKPECWNAIDDIDYGDWTWSTHEEVRSRESKAFACWRDHPELMRFPNGESLQNLLARAADAVRWTFQSRPGATVALVTHDSVVRALLLQLTGLPLSFYHGLTVSPCSVSEVVLTDGLVRLVRMNETAHLCSS